MGISVSEVVTLREVIPLVDRLSEVEREELRQFLESKTRIDWKAEWEKTVAHFRQVFAKFSEEEVEADLSRALNEVRSGRED
jgi:anti-sigma factor RsiW